MGHLYPPFPLVLKLGKPGKSAVLMLSSGAHVQGRRGNRAGGC